MAAAGGDLGALRGGLCYMIDGWMLAQILFHRLRARGVSFIVLRLSMSVVCQCTPQCVSLICGEQTKMG